MTSAPEPQLPHAPEIDDGRPEPVPPREVVISFWAWIATAVLDIALIPVVISDCGLLADEALGEEQASAVLRGDALELDPGVLRIGTGIAVGLVCVVVFALAAAYALFAFRMRAGKGWARGVLVGLTLCTVVSLFWVDTDWYGMSVVALSVFAALLMTMPTANAYFAECRKPGQR